MYVRKCECCGKYFWSKTNKKKYCSKKCAKTMAKIRREEKWQLCCTCKNACGGCLWSKYFLPVVGWDAEPTTIKDNEKEFSSYKIKKCPKYIKG